LVLSHDRIDLNRLTRLLNLQFGRDNIGPRVFYNYELSKSLNRPVVK